MKYIDLQEAFEIEVNKLDDNLTKPTSSITEYFLNAGLDKYWKTRYSAMNVKREGFEQTEKRIDDLRTLVQEQVYEGEKDITTVDSKLYTVTVPDNYVLMLGDTAGIQPADGVEIPCWEKTPGGDYIIKYTDTIEGTIETVDRIKENSLSEYHLHYTKARPIKLIAKDLVKLYTDGNYKVSKYILTFLRKPNKIDIHTNPFDEYTDMPEHTQIEIVKLAAQMYLENQTNPRYQSYTNEVNGME